ncbi:MAG: ABC transporter substrate-binding protein [archaeon]
MERKTLNILIGIVVVVVIINLILLLAVLSPTGKVVKGDEVVIGFIGPLTGDASAYGTPAMEIIRMAVKELNAAGGIDGKPLRIIYEDGVCDPGKATTAAQKLINVDGVKVILGGFCSGETLGAAPIAEDNKVILFSTGSGSPDVTNAGDYVFRNWPSDATSGSKVALEAIKRGDTRIALLSEQTDYSQAVKNVFKSTFKANGGTVTVDESILPDSNDFRSQITKIKSSNPDAIYLTTQTFATYGLALKQLGEMGVDLPIYTTEFATAEDILSDYAGQVEGAILAEAAFNPESPRAVELFSKIDAAGIDLGYLPGAYSATSYDAVFILAEAIEQCGEDTTCIKNDLYSIRNRQGAAGLLTMNSNGDPEFEYVIKTIRNGQVVEL